MDTVVKMNMNLSKLLDREWQKAWCAAVWGHRVGQELVTEQQQQIVTIFAFHKLGGLSAK